MSNTVSPLDYTIPLTVRLDISGMKHQIIHAFTQQEAATMAVLQRQLDAILSEENITHIIEATALEILQEELQKEIKRATFRALTDPRVRQGIDQLVQDALLKVITLPATEK